MQHEHPIEDEEAVPVPPVDVPPVPGLLPGIEEDDETPGWANPGVMDPG